MFIRGLLQEGTLRACLWSTIWAQLTFTARFLPPGGYDNAVCPFYWIRYGFWLPLKGMSLILQPMHPPTPYRFPGYWLSLPSNCPRDIWSTSYLFLFQPSTVPFPQRPWKGHGDHWVSYFWVNCKIWRSKFHVGGLSLPLSLMKGQ